MYEIKLSIYVKTEKELTDGEIAETIIDFKNRLEGYTTEYPKHLIDSDISISYGKFKK